jgi:hypothetical protein
MKLVSLVEMYEYLNEMYNKVFIGTHLSDNVLIQNRL